MRVDAHQHFWNYDSVSFNWINDDMAVIRKSFLPEHLQPILIQHKFDGCVLVQVNQTEEETLYFNKLAAENSFIKGVVGWTDLLSEKLEERLGIYAEMDKIKGFRHIVQGEPLGFMQNPAFISGVRKLVKHDFSFDILIFPKQLKDALFLVKNCPDNRFVLDHIAKPQIKEGKVSQWSNYIHQLAAYPNLSCKLSGMVTEADFKHWKKEDFYIYLDIVLQAFGIDRLLYGSDWPVCLVAASYAEQLDILESYFAELSLHERAKIFAENATKFYKLNS